MRAPQAITTAAEDPIAAAANHAIQSRRALLFTQDSPNAARSAGNAHAPVIHPGMLPMLSTQNAPAKQTPKSATIANVRGICGGAPPLVRPPMRNAPMQTSVSRKAKPIW